MKRTISLRQLEQIRKRLVKEKTPRKLLPRENPSAGKQAFGKRAILNVLSQVPASSFTKGRISEAEIKMVFDTKIHPITTISDIARKVPKRERARLLAYHEFVHTNRNSENFMQTLVGLIFNDKAAATEKRMRAEGKLK